MLPVNEKDTIKNTIEEEAEFYFIQFVFMKNRDLLRKKYRQLYDALFDRYLKVYKRGRKYKVSLFDIEKKFLNELTINNKTIL